MMRIAEMMIGEGREFDFLCRCSPDSIGEM